MTALDVVNQMRDSLRHRLRDDAVESFEDEFFLIRSLRVGSEFDPLAGESLVSDCRIRNVSIDLWHLLVDEDEAVRLQCASDAGEMIRRFKLFHEDWRVSLFDAWSLPHLDSRG